jgi:hypothetical protein
MLADIRFRDGVVGNCGRGVVTLAVGHYVDVVEVIYAEILGDRGEATFNLGFDVVGNAVEEPAGVIVSGL